MRLVGLAVSLIIGAAVMAVVQSYRHHESTPSATGMLAAWQKNGGPLPLPLQLAPGLLAQAQPEKGKVSGTAALADTHRFIDQRLGSSSATAPALPSNQPTP